MNQQQQQAGVSTAYRLGNLFASKNDNVRKKKRTPQAIKRMAMSIHAFGGVLQNLIVVPELDAKGKRTGRASVAGGETRRLGLCGLRDGLVPEAEGYSDDFMVPVLEVEDDLAAAASATENIQREDMHPADRFDAYKKLNDQCGSIEHVAAVFGVEPDAVARSLKLANASPKLFELYRQDGMTLDQLMALSITDDHDAQEAVWAAAKGRDYYSSPQQLRQALTAKELPTTAKVVQWVGIKDYEAAGGAIRRDLFDANNGGYVMDVELLRRMALDKLDKTATAVRREGWAWVELRLETTYGDLQAFGKSEKSLRPLTAAEESHQLALLTVNEEAQEALDTLTDEDDYDEAKADALRKAITESGAGLRKLNQRESAWAPEVLALAGAVVTIEQGKAVIHRGLVKPEDKKAMKKAVATSSPARSAGRPGQPEAAPKTGVSDGLARCLTAHKTVALQRVMADQPQVALAALAHNLVQSVLLAGRARGALQVEGRSCDDELKRFGEEALVESRAWTELQTMRAAWVEQLPSDREELLSWLIALPMVRLCELLSLCSALTVNGIAGDARPSGTDALAMAVRLDMADWWTASGESYFSRVPKSLSLAAVTESTSAEAAASLSVLKKDALTVQAETLIAGRRWLPAILRTRKN